MTLCRSLLTEYFYGCVPAYVHHWAMPCALGGSGTIEVTYIYIYSYPYPIVE